MCENKQLNTATPCTHSTQKLTLGLVDLNIKAKTIKPFDEGKEEYLHALGIRKSFLKDR